MKERLIYAEIAPEKQIDVALTLNSPGCPMEEIIFEDDEKHCKATILIAKSMLIWYAILPTL